LISNPGAVIAEADFNPVCIEAVVFDHPSLLEEDHYVVTGQHFEPVLVKVNVVGVEQKDAVDLELTSCQKRDDQQTSGGRVARRTSACAISSTRMLVIRENDEARAASGRADGKKRNIKPTIEIDRHYPDDVLKVRGGRDDWQRKP
jgi:hypothetical protein